MVTVKDFFQSIKNTRITKEERAMLVIHSNNKLIFTIPHSNYHATMLFLGDGKIDYHLTKEGKKKEYKSYGVMDIALVIKRSSERLTEFLRTHDLSFPFEKARRNKWKLYRIVLPQPKKKLRISEFLKTKIKKKRIKLSDAGKYDDVVVYTKNGVFRGFLGKNLNLLYNTKFSKEVKRIFNEEYRKMEFENKRN